MPLEIVVGAVVGAAAASAVNSPPVRQGLRKGVVYGLAGLLVAYDRAAVLAQGVAQAARQIVKSSKTPETATPDGAAAGARPPPSEAPAPPPSVNASAN